MVVPPGRSPWHRLDNNAVNGALNPAGISQTGGFVPTLASQWATLTYVFPGTVNRLRWRGVSQFGNNFFIDNFTVTDPPACPTPTAVSVANVSGFNADVSWTCAGCTGQYYVEYGAPGFTPGTTAAAGAGGTLVGPLAGTTTTLTLPAARTNYAVHVRQDCGGGIFSTNTAAVSFLSGCGASLGCNYNFHLTDNWGDSWNGALVEVRDNGLLVGTLGTQIADCEAFVTYELCHDSTLTLVCTNPGAFPDEPGLTVTDPFGGIVHEFRGPSFYPGNCAISYPNPTLAENLAVGTLKTAIIDCTEDPCIDPPVAGTLQADVTEVCSTGGTVTLSYSGGTGGIGQTIAWESSPNGITWSPIPAAAGLTSYTASPTDTTYYQVIVTCGAGGDTSNVFVVFANTFACYCAAIHGVGCGNGDIVNVTLNTLNQTSTCSPPAYVAYPPTGTATTTVEQGVSYNLGVTANDNCIISVWVDWDHNGVYDTYEWSQVTTGSVANVASSIGLQVPLTAVVGQTNMRIRTRFAGNPNGPTNACGTMGSGEAEDYIITVAPAPPCLPATALAISGVSTTGFSVNWTNGSNSCGTATYTVEYGPAGFVQGTGTSLPPVTAGPVSITGLSAVTQYDVYVTRDCTPCGDGPGASSFANVVTYPDCALAPQIDCPSGTGTFGPNGPGGWNFVEPLFGFTTNGTEQLFLLDANVLGSYTMSLTAAAGSSIVAVYIKPVGTCDPTGWTYVGTNQFTVQAFNFPVPVTGQYWVLVDPVSASLPINTYGVTFVCPVQNIDCANAETVTCGSIVNSSTSGLANSLPPTACSFFNASTGGSVWYSYTNTIDQEVTATTCGIAQFDTRLSVFRAVPDCSNLECVASNDDGAGCPDFSSEVRFPALANELYYIVVHGFGADEGVFQMNILCAPPCAPASTNDLCSQAATLIPALDDGSGVPTAGDNTCAYADGNTTCDPFGVMQGVWYSFNSGPNSLMFLDINLGTATVMNYALFDGACSGLGATSELDCVIGGEGVGNTLPALVPNTDYLLYVWNDGGVSQQGDFDVLLRAPALNDAAVDTILDPTGSLCSTSLDPRIVIRNNGENNLTSATISYDFDGGPASVFNWTGNLAYQETDTVILPTISTTLGVHTLNVSSSLPNGEVDGLTSNDAASKTLSITGETVVVAISTDNNGGQITWAITDAFGFTVASGGPYAGQNNVTVNTSVCLPTTTSNCYSFYLLDSGGDGLCCANGNGSWKLKTFGGATLLGDLFNSTPNGTNSPSTTPATAGYALGHEFCLPAGPSSILSSECNIFTNTLQSKVYTRTVAGATLYQFEFSDPDAGFRRRIALPRAWVQFSEMVTNPLLPGTVYFARARVDQGAAGFTDDRFGAGCEMSIDPASIACPTLINNTALPTHSCGVTKAFGGSDKIWAVPQLGATLYRFRFENSGEGYVREIQRTSYVCLLSWVTNPLVNGSTYSVTVNALVNGAWTGYCGAACSVTILNPAMVGDNSRMQQEVELANTLLFPNPVNDGLVNMQLAGLANSEHRISVEMFDVFGNRVKAEQFNTSGETFSTVLELDATMATGIYLVNITVDGVTTTKRLSVL